MDNNRELSKEEKNIWLMWKETYKIIFDRILKETYMSTGVSDGDFMVLDLLDRSNSGQLRQYELADYMGWTKSRLSHHLTRMEKRELVLRQSLGNSKGVQVAITSDGKTALKAAQPIISKGIQKYFINLLTDQDIESITKLATKTKELMQETEQTI